MLRRAGSRCVAPRSPVAPPRTWNHLSRRVSSSSPPERVVKVAGNEVLNGSTADKNINVLAKVLYKRYDLTHVTAIEASSGVALEKIEIVRDDYDHIGDSLTRLSQKVRCTFISFNDSGSGGIGPTHDDITYDAIARHLGVPLKLHQRTLNLMTDMNKNKPNWVLNDARKRMALFPQDSDIHSVTDLWVPVVVAGKKTKIWIFPGIPALFKQMLDGVQPHLPHGQQLTRFAVMTNQTEGELAKALTELQNRYPHIQMGSYPKWGLDKVLISLEGTDPIEVERVALEAKEVVGGYEHNPY